MTGENRAAMKTTNARNPDDRGLMEQTKSFVSKRI